MLYFSFIYFEIKSIASLSSYDLILKIYISFDENALYNKNKDKSGFCLVCNIYLSLEKKTKHCQFCNICVEGNDHHCPWTGKCIGKNNQKSFIIFVSSVFVLYKISSLNASNTLAVTSLSLNAS